MNQPTGVRCEGSLLRLTKCGGQYGAFALDLGAAHIRHRIKDLFPKD